MILRKLLYLLLCVACGRSSEGNKDATEAKRAEIAKLRSELNAAFEAGEAKPAGVIVQPGWTKQGNNNMTSISPSKVIVNQSTLKAAAALRTEINQAVASQGYTEEVRQLEAAIKSKTGDTANQAVVGSAQQLDDEMLGSSHADSYQANVVDAALLDIDLGLLQQLELSKRRTREMLILSRIVEDLQLTLGSDVSHWLQLQQNGSVYFVGRRSEDLLLLEQLSTGNAEADFHSYKPLQTLSLPSGIDAMLSYERWNTKAQLHESLLLLATQQQLLWHRLEAGVGLIQFWQWPLGNHVDRLLNFAVENREYLALMHNRTLSIYAYDEDRMEFWIVQHLQMKQSITALAVLDTGRDLLLALGQTNEALIYAHNMRELAPDAGLQLQLRQRLDAPQIADIAAFHMGGRSYLALGGRRPQILAYVQGQLLPKTVLGQNFGLVELFLPVPVRSYRDDMLLLVQHRVYFDTHSLIQLEVLIWNGEAFEASLPPPCELGKQTRYGAGCMLDEERDNGLTGAALLRHVQPPLLLVPRQSAPSGLFRLHTQLLPRNSELHDLQDIHDFMSNWIDEQDKLLQLAKQLLQMPELDLEPLELHTPLLINEGFVLEMLHVNEAPWTAADAGMDLHQLLRQIRLLKQQLQTMNSARDKRQPQLFLYDYEQLDFDIVEVQQLSIDKLNHAPFYVQNATMVLYNGSINMQRMELLSLKITESLESLPSSSLQRLLLSGDLSCEFINGLKWTQFLQQLFWRQEPLQLLQLLVQGAVVFEDSLHVNALNELNFPGDYLWSQCSSTSIVHGPKQFTQTLSVNALDTTGTINGLDPQDAITLSDAQEWPGWVTFTQLEVSEQFELNGSAQGRQFVEAPVNLMLTESHHIYAACHFDQLIVNGTLELHGLLDNSSYNQLLNDLAQRPVDANEELQIPAAKHVHHLSLPVDAHVLDGTLNGIPMEYFVTKHTQQALHNFSSLAGYVYFHRLQLSGLCNGVQLKQMLDHALRVDAPLLEPSTYLHFKCQHELQLAEFHVTRQLNDVPLASNYQTLQEPMHLSQARFECVQAEQLDVMHNVTGDGRLNSRQLNELLLHASQPDTVQVQELILPMGVEVLKLQELKAELLLDFLQKLDELPLLVLHGHLQVQHISVSGSMQVDGTLNGRDLVQLHREVVWLDRANELRTRWRFQQPPSFASDLLLQGSYNERLLPELLDDIVFRKKDKEHEKLVIGSTKSFVGNVRVLNTLQLEALNGVPFEQLANRLQPLEFAGVLHLEGQLHVAQLQLQGRLNDRTVRQLEKQLRYQPELDAFVQCGLIRLPQMQFQDLTVLGHLGNRSQEPLQLFFDDLVDKRQPQLRLESHKIFTGRVSIRHGAHMAEVNGIQVEQLLEQLIFINSGNEVTLHTHVHFAAPVHMTQLHVKQLVLQGERLNGCNVSEWFHDTLRVDRNWQAEPAVTFARGALDNNAMLVGQLNELELSHVVTLHTAQNLSFPLIAKDLHLEDGQIQLHGLVNGHNLTNEYANTLLTNAPHEQRVETPLLMQSAYISGTLVARSPINDEPYQNLSDVATLRAEQLRLQTPLHFARLYAPELRTSLHINGFNYNAWHEKSLWAQGRATQIISGNWRMRWLRVKQPLADQATHGVYRRQTYAFVERYRDLCQRLARLFRVLHLPFQVEQLRRRFTLQKSTDQADMRRIFALQSKTGDVNYLLLNEVGCWTRIYRWNGTQYASAGAFESGPIDNVIVLQLRNSTNQFSFMTSYEMSEKHEERSWNCSSLKNIQSWRTSDHLEIEPMNVPDHKLLQLQQQYAAVHQQQQRRVPSYQQAIKYLSQPTFESQLRPHLNASHSFTLEQYEILRERHLLQLDFRLQTEVNITQLSIPESDLYDDEQLVEDFLHLMQQIQLHVAKSKSKVFMALNIDTLPLPNNPARVLAARSAQLILPVLDVLLALHARISVNVSQKQEQQQQTLILQLEQTVHDVLLMANSAKTIVNPQVDDDTTRLHAVIARLRQLQGQLQLDDHKAESSNMQAVQIIHPKQHWQSVLTIRFHVGPEQRTKLLYASLTILAPDAPHMAPSTAPAAHIQLHHANGTLFQSLAAGPQARQLTALRVRDETLLAFVEHCCRVRVFIYRGIQGFVPFSQFETDAVNAQMESNVLQLLAIRVTLPQPSGVLYMLAVVQSRRVTFYELVVPGLFEPWLHCK